MPILILFVREPVFVHPSWKTELISKSWQLSLRRNPPAGSFAMATPARARHCRRGGSV